MIWMEMSYNKKYNRNDEVIYGEELMDEDGFSIYLFNYGLLENLTMECCCGVEEVFNNN